MTGPAPAGRPAAWADLKPGVPVGVHPGVTRLIAPNPGIMTGPGTNTYLIGSDRLALVDPGPDDDAHLAALLEACGDRLRWILVTHTHRDHSPLSRRLQEATGAEVIAAGPAPDIRMPTSSTWKARRAAAKATEPAARTPAAGTEPSQTPEHEHEQEPEAGQDGPVDPHDSAFVLDRRLGDGERLDCGDFVVEAVHTPGHTSNHLCFELDGTGLLFSGDHIMSGSTVVIAPPDGDMLDYLTSLTKVAGRSLRRIAPGHGGVIEDPAAVLDEYIRHRLDRESQILAQLAGAPAGGTFTDELVEAIYVTTPPDLRKVARFSVWAHLRKLAVEGAVDCPDPEDPDAPWSLAGSSAGTTT